MITIAIAFILFVVLLFLMHIVAIIYITSDLTDEELDELFNNLTYHDYEPF